MPRTPPPTDYVEPVVIREGETPVWLKELVETAIKHVFDGHSDFVVHGVRGKLCVSVAMVTVWALRQFAISSRLVVGSAHWKDYPTCFNWRGEQEYHAWVHTEFDEIVDLACDALSDRSDLSPIARESHAPSSCWRKRALLDDRDYTEIPGGHTELDVDLPEDKIFQEIANSVLAFARSHETEFQSKYGPL